MTMLFGERAFDLAASWPAHNNSPLLTAELARAHIGGMLKQWPMSPERVEKHLRALYRELAAVSPEADLLRMAKDFERHSEIVYRHVPKAPESEIELEQTPVVINESEPPPREWFDYGWTDVPLIEVRDTEPEPLLAPIHQEVLQLLAVGFSLPEVAKQLYKSYDTVKSRLRVMANIHGLAVNQSVLVAFAIRNGAVDVATVPRFEECPLSDIQLETMRYAAEGYTAEEIGDLMGSPYQTVRSRFVWISNRLGVSNLRHFLVAICIRNSWI